MGTRAMPYVDPDPVFVPAGFKYDPEVAFERNQPAQQSLRATDQETARVAAVHRGDGAIVGAGCLLDNLHILTCLHVVKAAFDAGDEDEGSKAILGRHILITLPGVSGQPTVEAAVVRIGGEETQNDLALLKLPDATLLRWIPAVEFASPLRHGGKSYSVLGFPGGHQQGRNAAGRLHAADAKGLVQMDRGGALSVLGGFSGAPVWSPDLNAFVGLVVTEYADDNVSWCIPSRRLCEFHPDLRVRFRIPPMDRPTIHDSDSDDPNKQLFGELKDNGQRLLRAVVREHKKYYTVNIYYDCAQNSAPRGHFVSFITYPDFKNDGEDAYELFAEIEKRKSGLGWTATQEFYPTDLFTVAAIGDGGDTVLTLDLEDVPKTLWKRRKNTRK
jgi:hypothetical protein